jgi:exosortase
MDSETAKNLGLKEELKRLLPERGTQIAWLVLAGIFVLFYWSSICRLTHVWATEEDYQHGFAVPLFSLFLLWSRRDMILPFAQRGSLWGLPFFVVCAVMRWVALYYNYGTLTELSMLPFFFGVAVFVGGWQGLRWAWPAIVFLGFMLPLPGIVQDAAREFLQKVATHLSVFVIQTLGIPAVAQGNVIQLTDRPLEVARACSGLRMMMLFFAICIGAAFIMRKPLWERLLILASAAPIAVLSNVTRIVMTAVLYEAASYWPTLIDLETQGETIHNWAGFLMMPIGLLLLLAETTLLAKLLIDPDVDRPLMIGKAVAGGGNEATSERALRGRRT